MLRKRVIPCLLIQDQGLVKTKQFKNPKYIGDPINALKIFNEKQADELIVLSIDKDRYQNGPDFDLISELTTECFMPLAYGGGITKLTQIDKLFRLGVEKVVLGNICFEDPNLVKEAISIYGSQSFVGVIDVKKSFFGNRYLVKTKGGQKKIPLSVVDYTKYLEDLGVGEIVVQFIDREGLRVGYDHEILSLISGTSNLPVLALGGASSFDDFRKAFESGVSGVVAGSFFVMIPPYDAVLITYPTNQEIINLN
jgi:cyclase